MSTFIAAETDSRTLEWHTGLTHHGITRFANGRSGGLYDDDTARRVIAHLADAGINAHITSAENYNEGLRKTGTEM